MRCCGASGAVPPRSLLPPSKGTPLPPYVRGVVGRSAKRRTAAPVPPPATRRPAGARCCCRLVAEARYCSAGTAQVRSRRLGWCRSMAACRARSPVVREGRDHRLSRSPRPPPIPVVKVASWPSNVLDSPLTWLLLAAVQGRSGVSRSRGSGQRDAIDCTRLRLVWFVSAQPRSPRSVGAKDRWSTYRLWTRAAVSEAEEARESLQQVRLPTCTAGSVYVTSSIRGWRTAKRPELQKRKGGEKEKEMSELANSPSSTKSESCGGGQPSDRSYRRGREQSRRKKRPNWQILPAVLKVRAAWPPPLPSVPSLQELTDQLSVPRRTDEHGSRNDC
ncbi:uncharacterized protein LOC143164337 [Aptenodytes patagonicus]|uniref:uncharacterized protein LOC143164337 n=1 Tax=Aptenodytes patagonicus TaxID=9234 RepID=UPI003FA0A46D